MQSSLRVLNPVDVLPANIEDSNVPTDDFPEWSSTTTYSLCEKVKVENDVYQSLVDANINNNPSAAGSSAKWQKRGVINRMNAFDKKLSTKVKNPNEINYTIKMGRAMTTLAVLGAEGATSIQLIMENDGVDVFDKTLSVFPLPSRPGLWYWLYGQKEERTEAKFFDLPTYPSAKLKLKVLGSEDLAVGEIAIGNITSFGLYVLSGAGIGFDDYSRKERDEFGEWEIVERSYSKWTSLSLLLEKSEVDAMNKFVAKMRAKPAVWIGSNSYESTTVYGMVKSFEVAIKWALYSECQLVLEGMNEE